MKKYLLMALFAMSLFIPQAHAQWVVTDPGNFAGNIANSIKGDCYRLEDGQKHAKWF